MLTGESIVCFAPDAWGDIWRNRHRLLSVFALRNKVLYVEPRIAVRSLLKKLRSGAVKPRHFFGERVTEARENIFVYRDPIHLPRTTWRGIGPAVDRLRDKLLLKAMGRLSLKNPVLWLVRPDSWDVPGKLREKVVMYQMVDDYLSYAGLTERARARIQEEERILASRADILLVTSEYLLEVKRHLGDHLILVRNGVDRKTLEEGLRPEGDCPEELRGARRPIYGYIGGITEKLDMDLLEKVAVDAREKQGGTLVFVGTLSASEPRAVSHIEKLRSLPHVLFLGQRDVSLIPAYLRAFDVCLVPYRIGSQSKAIDPLKLYEYLAFGKPIVSVDIPSVRRYAHVLKIGRTHEEFVRLLGEAALEKDQNLAEERRAIARENTWEARAEQISAAVEEAQRKKGLASRP
jgi:glycosyltransferase involved in cell wall biosynthesis